ncbi:MAG: prepilin-type N-terminal cleavage/methylation domain-containing protein [Planctomycetota bacterium]
MIHCRKALTLIELIVALTLASLLMAALLRLTTDMAKETRQLKREQVDRVALGLLEERVRTDVLNARGVSVRPRSLTLAGFVAPQLTHGRVQYQCVTDGQRDVLIRRVNEKVDLCWVGCSQIRFESLQEVDPELPVSAAAAGLPPMPGIVRVQLFDERGTLLLSARVEHHDD